jgi:perosamine synthetase
MTASKCALLGGVPVRREPYPLHRTTGIEESNAVARVMESGILSAFEGTNNEYFLGGQEVKSLERAWAARFKVKYAVAVNSATSGLLAAVAAVGAGPGDEVIVTPFTMSGTVSSILACNAVPVFVDVDPVTFNLDPSAVESKITKRTKAILVVHIFGQPADMDPLMTLAHRHGLAVIEDAAQAPGALYRGQAVGTIGDIGVFSLNCNKHIQCGEGGVAVTNDELLAKKLRLIRNHGEAVIASGMEVDSLSNMLGFNFRMTELEAAIAHCQLKKLDGFLAHRMELVADLTDRLQGLSGLILPPIREGCTHVYYRYPVVIDRRKIPLTARQMVRALNAEGMDFYVSYMKPLYLQPLFQKQVAHGEKGCPFKCPWYHGQANFSPGLCPTAESLEERLLSTEVVRPPQTSADMAQIEEAFKKVLSSVGTLKKNFDYEENSLAGN